MSANSKTLAPMILLLALGLSGCVTEGGLPDRDPEASAGPVEAAQVRVREMIGRLPYETGSTLLQTLQGIVAFERLAVSPVIEALPHSTAPTRANLIWTLGYLGGVPARQAVLAATRDPDQGVRYEAAAALLNMGDQGGLPMLIGLLESPDRKVRYKALEALQEATGETLGYDFGAPPAARQAAVERWRAWWDSRRDELIFAPEVRP